MRGKKEACGWGVKQLAPCGRKEEIPQKSERQDHQLMEKDAEAEECQYKRGGEEGDDRG